MGGLSVISSLIGSWGFGMVNFVFTLLAVYTIDMFGRRKLLLTTFPCMALSGLSFTSRRSTQLVSLRTASMATSIGPGSLDDPMVEKITPHGCNPSARSHGSFSCTDLHNQLEYCQDPYQVPAVSSEVQIGE